MKVVYLAGPYRSDTEYGVHEYIQAGKWIERVRQHRAFDKLILDLNTPVSKTYGRRKRVPHRLVWSAAEDQSGARSGWAAIYSTPTRTRDQDERQSAISAIVNR